MAEKNFLTKTLTETVMTRRSFLKWSAALGGTTALAGGIRYGLNAVGAAAEKAAETEGKWVSAACWHNCGGRCVNKAYVVDGVVVRQKTDDTHPDSPDFPQMRGCARGRSQRRVVFGADRLKYPMKRKNWAPGGGKKELRGRDEWVRISWDEALDIVASEIKRIEENYGSEAIFLPRGEEIANTLSLYGGYIPSPWGGSSLGTWGNGVDHMIGAMSWGVNDRFEYRKSKLIVMWGKNPIWTSGGNPTYNFLQAKKAGAKFIFVDPYYNDSAVALADEWIPIRPATDTTLLLAIAHVLLMEDDPSNNPLIDWDFINRCTIGFDKDHLPEGADPEDNFKDYVLGLDASGGPASEGHKNFPAKTPEWAAEICGVPPIKIRSFAREIATTRPTAFLCGYAPARVNEAQSVPQAFMTVGAMIGSMGVSGGGVGPILHGRDCDRAMEAPPLIKLGSSGATGVENPLASYKINNNEIWTSILKGKITDKAVEKRDFNIQLIYHGNGNKLQTIVGQADGIAAHRKVEFVVAHNYVLAPSAAYADVVLPATTWWERFGGFSWAYASSEMVLFYSQVTDPLFEAKDDSWIAVEIGKRLELDPQEIFPVALNQQIYNQLAGAQVITPDGADYETLLTLTAEDIAALGVEGQPQTGKVPFKDFKEKGVFQIERYPGDAFGYIAYKAFRDDPEGHPLTSASGKLEIHCQALVDLSNSHGWTKIRPIPTYIPPSEGYEGTFDDWENKVKGEYPLQLYTIHYARRSHTIFNHVQQLRRAFPQEFFINPYDAESRGIKNGDTVLIKSRRGQAIRPAYVTERIMPGVVDLPHGAWVEVFDEEIGIDKAGSDNFITGSFPTVTGHQGFNSVNVQIEKWTGEHLAPDYTWPQRIPLKEA
jgi:anaerobic dimethyl sulfoxide reductase subunit A